MERKGIDRLVVISTVNFLATTHWQLSPSYPCLVEDENEWKKRQENRSWPKVRYCNELSACNCSFWLIDSLWEIEGTWKCERESEWTNKNNRKEEREKRLKCVRRVHRQDVSWAKRRNIEENFHLSLLYSSFPPLFSPHLQQLILLLDSFKLQKVIENQSIQKREESKNLFPDSSHH